MSTITQDLAQVRQQAEAALGRATSTEATRAWYREFLGRKGRLTRILRLLGSLPAEERVQIGQAANELKQTLEAALRERQAAITKAEMKVVVSAAAVDVTLPGRLPNRGELHPTTKTLREMYTIFGALGFQVYETPEVETDELNFQLLNIPPGHPARDMQDTFYTTTPDVLLRTQTSPGQIRLMRACAPEPIRVLLPGKVYRYEQMTATHDFMFYQVEGLAVGRQITFSDLKGVLVTFANQMYGPGRRLRFRKSYFPFTEPSVEIDMDCVLCNGTGCPLCKHTGWLEILGAGMVHPTVLQNGGYDPAVYSGFAFGIGPERVALLKYGIDHIRYFYSNDARMFEHLG